jgi:hypothetical protein
MNEVVDTRKTFCSLSENDIIESMLKNKLDGTLDCGGRFFGILEDFNENSLFIRGDRGQMIIIKRKRISRLEAVV